MSVFGSSTAII